ncbi:MAG: type II toxin-antitoxin system HicA family toxin [Methanotrichaceae archaeon]
MLERSGFVLDRVKGSHHVYYHPQTKKTVVISFHGKDLPKGILNEILSQDFIYPGWHTINAEAEGHLFRSTNVHIISSRVTQLDLKGREVLVQGADMVNARTVRKLKKKDRTAEVKPDVKPVVKSVKPEVK